LIVEINGVNYVFIITYVKFHLPGKLNDYILKFGRIFPQHRYQTVFLREKYPL